MKLQRLSNEQYHSRPGLSSSDLKALARSPKTWMMERKASKRMDLGTIFHDFILEGVDRSLVLPKVNKASKAGLIELIEYSKKVYNGTFSLDHDATEKTSMEMLRAQWTDCETILSLNNILIDQSQKDTLEAMKESFYSHPEAASYLNRQDKHGVEESFEVDARDLFETDLDVKIKIRPDYVNITEGYIVDLKSTRNADRFAFNRDVKYNFQYHASAALYMKVLELEGIKTDSFFLLATENQEPHVTEVYRLSEETLSEGWQVILEGWRRYEEYIAGGYLGYHGGVVEL